MKRAIVVFAALIMLLSCIEIPFAATADDTNPSQDVSVSGETVSEEPVSEEPVSEEPVTVKPETEPVTTVPELKSVRFIKSAKTVKAGKKFTLTVKGSPKNAEISGKFKSSNPDVAKVSSSGVVKAIKKGKAKIIFTSKNGLKATCNLTVVKATKNVTLSEKKVNLVYDKKLKKGTKYTLSYTIDKGAYNKVNFKTSNKNIATVNEKGVIVPKKAGNVKITVKAFGGAKAVCKVKIEDNNDTNNSLNQRANRMAIKKPGTVKRVVYGTTVLGRPLEAYVIKAKKSENSRVLFADFACHGFEDSYYRDGKVLVKIGNDVVEYYAKNTAKLGKYTMVIVPCANPDGTIAGRNNQRACSTAFGRCTAAHVDMNRDFAAFRGKESRALRDLMKNYPPRVYLNFHGWLNTSIGTPWLARLSTNTLGFGRVQTNWNAYGYIIRHVKFKYGASVCLVEYRSPSSAKRASGRTETFLNKIMR